MLRQITNKTGRACHDFSMLKDNDKILICFSGGKDSLVLIKVLLFLKKKYPINFELKVLCVNPNFDETFKDKIKNILNEEKLDFEILNTQISSVIETQNSIKKMSSCFMCSRLRRGIIYNYAIENGYNKIALGHTLDDAIETHLMNLFFSNKTSFLKPKYLAENKKIEVIRPMIYVNEELIIKYIKSINYGPISNNCPMRGNEKNSKREYFREVIKKLYKDNPKIKESAYHAFKNTKELNQWDL